MRVKTRRSFTNFKSLRFRIPFWVTIILASVFTAIGAGFYLNRSHQLLSDMDVALKARADWIEGLARQPAQANNLSLFQEEMEEHTDLGREGRTVQILNESGKILFRSSNLNESSLPVPAAELAQLGPCQWTIQTMSFANKNNFRLITQNGREKKDEGTGFFVQVGLPLDGVKKSQHRLFWILSSSIPLGALLIGLGAWLLVSRALKPVDAIIQEAKKIEVDHLERRLKVPRTGDEIEELAATLNAMFDKLERNFKQMRQFIADAAHEIRTPLGILAGEIDVALKAPRSPEEHQRIFESSREEIARLATLMERLLLLSHLDAGQWRWEMRSVYLKKFLCELEEKARLLANGKNLQVILKADEELVIEGDEMRLRQLLLNLVDNAVKNSNAKGRITLSMDRENGYIKIGVQDEGIGIPPEHIPRIFDRFYRVDKSRERTRGGYGLGLSISKAIAQAHHGKIEVQSEAGRGSLFTLYLPFPSVAPERPPINN